MERWHRELISRGTAAVLGLALLYGGWRCLATGWHFDQYALEQAEKARDEGRHVSSRRSSGSGLPYAVGVMLVVLGAAITGISILPAGAIYRLYAPDLSKYEGANTLAERFSNDRRWR